MIKTKIIFFGTPYFVVPVLKKLYEEYEVLGVVTMPDSIQGRKKILTPTPVKAFALENSIPVINLNELTTENRQLKPDLFVVSAYGKIISQEILDIPKFGALNIHPSLLPKFRGPTPIQSAILEGEKISGVSIIKMDDKMDHGPIVSQWTYPISENDTFESLHIEMFKDAAAKIPDVIKKFVESTSDFAPQNEDEATVCEMISKESGFFDCTNPPSPKNIDLMTRAYYPWPTAWTKVRIKNNEERIMKLLPDGMIQFEGGKPMKIKDAINGYPDLKQLLEQLVPQQP
ncbi:MAG: methionyl-tRNA formyltransferase [Candidatus Levybacteria bacterium]|nr:methionyl-tRNA formyltransferase [Candidatus Levybacteria bacterium]